MGRENFERRYCNSKKLFFVVFVLLLTAVILLPLRVNAGSQNFETPRINPNADPDTGEPLYINFENIGFELPVNSDGVTDHHMDNVPGWSTVPVFAADLINPNAFIIEMWRSGNRYGVPSAEGYQFVELNAYVEGMLYQICDTQPGQKVYWEFFHRGRNGVDTMEFFLFDKAMLDHAEDAAPLAEASDGNSAWGYYNGTYTVPDGQERTAFAFRSISAAGGNKGIGNFLDGIDLFYPSFLEVNKTVETEACDIHGNYAVTGDLVTYQVEIKNTGETATSRTVMTDILPDGVVFIDDSVRILYTNADGTTEKLDASDVVTFDPLTDLLMIKAGRLITGATIVDENRNELPNTAANNTRGIEANASVTITFQVKITKEVNAAEEIMQNQAKVTYNDLGFERFNVDQNGKITDDYNVSPVVDLRLLAKVEMQIEKVLTEKSRKCEPFLFRIDYRYTSKDEILKTFYQVVEVEKYELSGSCFLDNLRPGFYTVTELKNNWEYQILTAGTEIQYQQIDKDTPVYAFSFENTRVNSLWVSGKENAVNSFADVIE